MKVVVYPNDPKPYTSLLYKNFNKSVIITYLNNPLRSHNLSLLCLPFQIGLFRLKGYKLFHLHWVFQFRFSPKNIFCNNIIARFLYSAYFLLILFWIKVIGFKLIWTVHDLIPHKHYFIDDILINRLLSFVVDGKVVHSQSTISDMTVNKYNTDNCKMIPIGNYGEIYPNMISQQEARIKLKIHKDNFVIGYIGRIEHYKGIYELVDIFLKLNNKNIKLLIAGFCKDEELQRNILNKSKLDSRIILNLGFIPNDSIQVYLNCVDVVVYPFRMLTSSSSVFLAFSFKRTVISPRIGEIKDLPTDIGIFYEGKNGQDQLLNSLLFAINNKELVKNMGMKAYDYIKQRSWKKSAQQTYSFYKLVLNNIY